MADRNLKLVQAHDYLEKVIEALHHMGRHDKGALVIALENLSHFIRSTRQEIGALSGIGAGQKPLSVATEELQEIVVETARATNAIMAATEAIEAAAQQVKGPQVDTILREASRIYEACSFQDITGQRISKAARTLQQCEGTITTLAAACGHDVVGRMAVQDPFQDDRVGDAALLNGPQLSGSAKSQEEIDRLLESLG